MLLAHSLLEEDDVIRYESNGETVLLLETVKSMHCLGYFWLRYVLIYNLEVSPHFHSTFLQLTVSTYSLYSKNCCFFFLTSSYLLQPPDNSNSSMTQAFLEIP